MNIKIDLGETLSYPWNGPEFDNEMPIITWTWDRPVWPLKLA